MVGTALAAAFASRGDTVVRLVRRESQLRGADVLWHANQEAPPASAFEGADAVIHLAGESIGQRWTEEKKREIRDSRVKPTRWLAESLGRVQNRPRALVVASAVGLYGDRGDEILDESSAPGEGFLASVVQEWEEAADPARQAGVRVVNTRFAMILSPAGGALARMLPLFKAGLGGPLGSGRQWWSWVALADVVRAILFLLDGDSSGGVIVSSPNPVTNSDFTAVLANVLHRPAVARVPPFALRLVFNGMADETLLNSARLAPRRLLDSGFEFEFPELRSALLAML
jgi:uncharacterized protein (TIGR01777 family)